MCRGDARKGRAGSPSPFQDYGRRKCLGKEDGIEGVL